MVSMYLLLISSIATVTLSACNWTVLTPFGDKTLNLAPLDTEVLNTTDSDEEAHIYLFTPCRNGETCDGNNIMVKQYNPSDPDYCYNLGRWDRTISPDYESDNGGRYYFVYPNGAPDCGNPARTWAPIFQCDPSTKYQVSEVMEIPGSCFYEVVINTYLACDNYTTTTTYAPDDQCIWTDGDHTLNLTLVKGFVLNKISDNNPSQIYSLSPCSNNIQCNQENGMITVGTISDCIQRIATWEQGINEPRYLGNFGGQWEFVYTNGDSCNNGPQSVVTVFWNCDPLAGTVTITAAKEVGICNFEIQIDSNLAC